MKLVLVEALHARPADLLVRRAAQLASPVFVSVRGKRAQARKILEVLGLGAQKGDEVELASDDPEALAAIATLIREGFDPDLVPAEAAAVVEGVAIGVARVLEEEARAEVVSLEEAFARARAELAALIAALPAAEAALFAPETTLLEELEPVVQARVAAGEVPSEAVAAAAASGATDLLDDARRRVLDALAGRGVAAWESVVEPTVLVTPEVTPSMVARLPDAVVGVLVATDDAPTGTSHAAILARGRGLPLAFVAAHVAAAIEDGVLVVLDTTASPARVWPSPSPARVAEAEARRAALARQRAEAEASAQRRPRPCAIRVNVGSVRDAVPAAADGVGLLRSELLFADRGVAPSEEEQVAAYAAVAAKTEGPCVVRLFDAGGDKPLPFLPAPATALDARGFALLAAHPAVLAAQVRAIARVPRAAVLIPLVRGPEDVAAVRALAPSGARVGAMVETPAAAHAAAAIAEAADFVCIGTNDLSCETLGIARAAGPDALDPRVLAHVRRTVEGAHAHGRAVTVCGEVAADPHGARVLLGLGVDALSVAPARLSALVLDLADVTRERCEALARSHLP